ncbi:MAG: copper amine oxidase N-terminal domain-containing protein [bacterium]
MLKNWGMLVLLAGFILPALANEPEAIVINGHSMMPLRVVSESFGAGIQYNSRTKEVDFGIGYQKTTMTVGSKTARVDNKVVILDEAPVVVAGVTYVPARFVSVVIGATISFGSDNRVCIEHKGKKVYMHTRRHTPPGLEKKGGVPPGLAKKGGFPPGLAKKHGISPGEDSHMKGDRPPSPDFHNMKGNTSSKKDEHRNNDNDKGKKGDMQRENDKMKGNMQHGNNGDNEKDKNDKNDKNDKKDHKGDKDKKDKK